MHESPLSEEFIEEFCLRQAIRLVIGGTLFDDLGNEESTRLERIPTILREIAQEYEDNIEAGVIE